MASSGSGKFFLFVLLCLALTAYLLWTKFYHKQSKIATPEEACYLLHANNDERAEMMFERKFERIEYPDGSRYYSAGEPFWGGIGFLPHQDFYYFRFNQKSDFTEFASQFHDFQKLGASSNCKERYAISNDCVACELKFREGMNCYILMMMNSPSLDGLMKTLPR